MMHYHSFADVGKFSYTDHVRASFPAPLALTHLGQLDSNAAQAAAFLPVYDNPHPPYALVLVANYYGSSSLHLLRPGHKPLLKPLAVLQTECGHSWAAWEQGGRRWAAVANYCSKDDPAGSGAAGSDSRSGSSASGSGGSGGGHKGVVVYELEQLAAASSSVGPDWGFKAAAALTAKGASHVLHLELPGGVGSGPGGGGGGSGGRRRKAAADTAAGAHTSWLRRGKKAAAADEEEEEEAEEAAEDGGGEEEGQQGGEEKLPAHVLAVAAYGSDEVVLYGLSYGRVAGGGTAGLSTRVLQRIRLPGVSALAACRGGGGQLFLMGLSYYDKGFSTRSAVYRWDGGKRQFVLLQVLATDGAHGGRCFPVYEQGADPTTSGRLLSSSHDGGGGSSSSSSSKAGAAGGQQQQQQQGNRHNDQEVLYLAIANSRSGEEYEANSTIWRYDPAAGRFLLHQTVETVGAHDVQHFRLPPRSVKRGSSRFASSSLSSSSSSHQRRPGAAGMMGSGDEVTGPGLDVLVFANRGVDQECSLDQHSPILVWHPGRRRFEPTAHLSGLSCATGLAAGRLRQHGAAGPPTTYLVATGDRSANGSHTGPMTHLWTVEEEKAPGSLVGAGAGIGGGGGEGHFTSTLQR
ncbi:hypothetical protein HYH02_008641 [Chlamydomonas schloesseri]|uniref:Uncharacterized protein n=1 Tax=Chlamydomonas schloesseri TaxID=2026947 RepID=A0A835WD28_9CHLO|nr:hypothetical protein HYH02_008641 [Chlamydomonas schloesseri]|eukprot:KAG2445173.1 hypothetical protein HYH02_008641 [Chlamydomonas schloesseri]